ncbi:MAG: hypothetical protein H8D45_24510 [Bacteroidetes bacterium]|nr:hypothetical protein [Bacteroidota bacterium]MBL7104416.1 hypothetical protein [Bacteroidales bacterium]
MVFGFHYCYPDLQDRATHSNPYTYSKTTTQGFFGFGGWKKHLVKPDRFAKPVRFLRTNIFILKRITPASLTYDNPWQAGIL